MNDYFCVGGGGVYRAGDMVEVNVVMRYKHD